MHLMTHMSHQVSFKRISGSAQVIMKTGDGNFVVQIDLDGTPAWEWVECFSHPRKYKLNEAHPGLATIVGNSIIFESTENGLEENIAMMDDYLEQANVCYAKKLAQEEAEEKRVFQQEEDMREELAKVNQRLKNL